MKIVEKPNKDIMFCNVSKREVFATSNNGVRYFYMKLGRSYKIDGRMYNAVNLDIATLVNFEDDNVVESVNGKFVED